MPNLRLGMFRIQHFWRLIDGFEILNTSEQLKEHPMWSPKGTVVTIEGPRFSTRAESLLFKSWNCDVINMTTGKIRS